MLQHDHDRTSPKHNQGFFRWGTCADRPITPRKYRNGERLQYGRTYPLPLKLDIWPGPCPQHQMSCLPRYFIIYDTAGARINLYIYFVGFLIFLSHLFLMCGETVGNKKERFILYVTYTSCSCSCFSSVFYYRGSLGLPLSHHPPPLPEPEPCGFWPAR